MTLPPNLLDTLVTALATVRARSPRATTRTLSADDLAHFCASIAAVEPNADDVTLRAVLYGGFVPNSYRYMADADVATVEIDLRTGEARTSVARDHAQRRPHGKGSLLVLRLLREGQSQGRVL